jgi:hypothetical protein
VEQKVAEADFFLYKLEETTDNLNLFESQNYLSAFLSASRSIYSCLQSSISDHPEFEKWYKKYEDELSKNNLARYFVFARNHSQKVGFYPIGSGAIIIDTNGKRKGVFFFSTSYNPKKEMIPEIDIVTACKEYFRTWLSIVLDCYRVLGHHIDPDIRYTTESLVKLGLTIEDLKRS